MSWPFTNRTAHTEARKSLTQNCRTSLGYTSKRNYWTRTKVHGPAASMVKLIPAMEVVRKPASLGETREQGTAGNGAMKASDPEAKTVHGRHPILRRRREAEPRALARKREMPARGDRNLEKEAGPKRGRNLKRELKVSASSAELHQAERKIALPASTTPRASALEEMHATIGIPKFAGSLKQATALQAKIAASCTHQRTISLPLLESSRRLQAATRMRIQMAKPRKPRLRLKLSLKQRYFSASLHLQALA